MKILLIAATHGNELLGIKLYERLLKKRSPLLEKIDFVIGNPKAYAKKLRYTDKDLNRSYEASGTEYEVLRAREIKEYIRITSPDIVLDMHTTNCVQPNCLIVHNLDGDIKKKFLRASHIDTVLQVQAMGDIVGVGDNVIGYEVPNNAVTPMLLDAIAQDLQNFVSHRESHPDKKFYRMLGKIYKQDVSQQRAKSFVNFQKHDLGFVPIMTGNNSYKKQTDYLGFKASETEEIKV
ncbi:succinylglutamate desuccinylase/aspartoacylase family protein [Candidatus Saccharibacteria bacterium]|nr:succinylglutamate desuccinylase/aspartoacylase family protein [Candidatus Saccharibacteria bacterium]